MVTTLKRAWQCLTGGTPGKTQADLAGKYTHSQALLSANNQALTLLNRLELSTRRKGDLIEARLGKDSPE